MELEFLQELFQAHGVSSYIHGEWLVFPTHNLAARLLFFPPNQRGDLTTIQMDLQAAIGPNQTLIESFAGMGGSVAEAIADAKRNFVMNSFHVLLSVLFQRGSEQTTQEDWTVGGRKRRVTLGDIGTRGTLPENLDGDDIFQWVQTSLETYPLSEGIHWIRFYYAQAERKPLSCEVLIDNVECVEIQSAMAAQNWPSQEKFYSVRLFLMVQDGAGTSAPVR